jgi:hypothetical protein
MEQKERLKLFKKYFKKWIPEVSRYGWNVKVIYCKTKSEMPEFHDKANAACNPSFDYLRAKIHVNLEANTNGNGELTEQDIEQIVIHETIHVVTSAMKYGNSGNDEYVTTILTRIITGRIGY